MAVVKPVTVEVEVDYHVRVGAKIRYWSPSGTRLSLGHDGDAGIDLPASERVLLNPATWTNVPIDVCVELPHGHWALIMGRSSTFFRKHLLVNQAVIDNGYRGPLFVCVHNPTPQPYEVAPGERLAQLVLMRLAEVKSLVPVSEDEFSTATSRGAAGFGSTG